MAKDPSTPMSDGPRSDGSRGKPQLDPETREAFEKSYARYERMLKKLAKL